MKIVTLFFITAAWAAPLAAQDTDLRAGDREASESERPYRSPDKARVLGTLFPGAGHVYAGEYLRGYVFYLRTVAGIGGSALVYLYNDCLSTIFSATSCDPGPQWPRTVMAIGLLGAGVWSWISGARDAPLAAERANERHRRKTMRVSPLIQPASVPGAGAQVGLVVHW